MISQLILDITAGALLVEEAGGKIFSFDQTVLNFMKPEILATNGLLHQKISEQIMLIRSRIPS